MYDSVINLYGEISRSMMPLARPLADCAGLSLGGGLYTIDISGNSEFKSVDGSPLSSSVVKYRSYCPFPPVLLLLLLLEMMDISQSSPSSH